MTKIDKRIAFLAQKFDVFDNEDVKNTESEFSEAGYEDIEVVEDPLTEVTIALLAEKYRNDKSTKKLRKVSVEVTIFGRMISADPTSNKQFVQWMLTIFTNFLKNRNISDAIRFACEDLPRAKEYLEIFENNKRKASFKRFCSNNFSLRHIGDCTNIDQYRSLSELFDAVDPYIEKDVSGLRGNLMRFVNNGDAEITFKDRHFIVYIPLTRDASVVFDNFASWCTNTVGNGMYQNYTNQLRPDKSKSKLYVIIPIEYFTGETEEIYQLHFESGQFMDRRNLNADIVKLFDVSDELSHYFEDELFEILGTSTKIDGKYKNWLFKFNLGYVLFALMDGKALNLKFKNDMLGKVPDTISRFKNLNHLVMTNCRIKTIDENIGELSNLTLLALNDNKITKLPISICRLKKLKFLSLVDNPIKDIDKSISDLDVSKGGSLEWVVVSKKSLANKLSQYLPNAEIDVIVKTKYSYDDL
tara:strand:+ start:8507 stop:9919 length:1413 start_codon:yes stop_codon:yes gene_type:complete